MYSNVLLYVSMFSPTGSWPWSPLIVIDLPVSIMPWYGEIVWHDMVSRMLAYGEKLKY